MCLLPSLTGTHPRSTKKTENLQWRHGKKVGPKPAKQTRVTLTALAHVAGTVIVGNIHCLPRPVAFGRGGASGGGPQNKGISRLFEKMLTAV